MQSIVHVTAYGNEISFSTLSIVTTTAIVSFTSNSAVVTGNIIFGRTGEHLIGSGICWSTSQNPTTDDSKTMNSPYSGIFTSNLEDLTQGTTYFVRAYAEYDNGPTIYGNELASQLLVHKETEHKKLISRELQDRMLLAFLSVLKYT